MGRISKQVLGLVRGKVGGYVIRKRYGKSVVYQLPEKVNISQTPQAKNARAKFLPMSQFCSYVNSIPELNYIWKKEKIDASSSYHKILKTNYPGFDYNRPTKSNGITPTGTLYCPVIGSSVTAKGFNIEILIKEVQHYFNKNVKEITAIGVICYYDPLNKRKDYFVLSKIIMDSVELISGESVELLLPFNEEQKDLFSVYRGCILYFTLVTKDMNGISLGYSNRYSEEFVRNIARIKKTKG